MLTYYAYSGARIASGLCRRAHNSLVDFVSKIPKSYRYCYWRMQNNCSSSNRFKRSVFQRCSLLLVVNVKKKAHSVQICDIVRLWNGRSMSHYFAYASTFACFSYKSVPTASSTSLSDYKEVLQHYWDYTTSPSVINTSICTQRLFDTFFRLT
jgi:hypothetical protein